MISTLATFNFGLLLNVLVVHIFATMSPGPNFALVIHEALTNRSRQQVFSVVAGVGLGIFVHCSLALFGVSYALKSHPGLFLILKVLGAAYLAFLGIKSLVGFHRELTQGERNAKSVPHQLSMETSVKTAFNKGFGARLLNPKALIYFTSVLPQVMESNIPIEQAFVTPVILATFTLIWFAAVAMLVFRVADHWILGRIKMMMTLATGMIFLGLTASVVQELIGQVSR